MCEIEIKEEILPPDVEKEGAMNINNVSEKQLLGYFSEKSKKVMPSTLWSYYSMLKW
ncbi:unnamed protein product [Tenebrio molitor]|nr:unnamed protein product [Tenebrio molitor]